MLLEFTKLNSPSFVLPAPVYLQIGLLLQHMPQWDNSRALMRLDRCFADGRCLGILVFLSDDGSNSHFDANRVRIGSGYSQLDVRGSPGLLWNKVEALTRAS